MGAFADRVARRRPASPHVVNIGIGGSDLGPAMAYRALEAFRHERIACRFVSNVDGADIAREPRRLDPATTLFIVASKTFTTIETLTNARTARRWLVDALGEAAVAEHFVAVSTNAEQVAAFGIDTANMFGFWDWVGGRYSVDSAIGLSLMIAIGPERFREFLRRLPPRRRALPHRAARGERAGAHGAARASGTPTCSAPRPRPCCRTRRSWAGSRPTCSSSTWRATASACASTARRSYGDTGPIVWGEPGTNGQHAFYQLLHQGTRLVPVDFIGFATPNHPLPRAARPVDGEPVRPDRGAGVRQDAEDAGRGLEPSSPPSVPRQPARARRSWPSS